MSAFNFVATGWGRPTQEYDGQVCTHCCSHSVYAVHFTGVTVWCFSTIIYFLKKIKFT